MTAPAPTPSDILQEAGLLDLGENPSMEAVEAALENLAEANADVSPLRHGVIREGAIQVLARAGIRSPAGLVDAALDIKKSDEPDETTDYWRTHGPPIVDLMTSPDGLCYLIAEPGRGVGIVERVEGREPWPAKGLPWPAIPDAGAVLYALEAGGHAPWDDLRGLIEERVVLPTPTRAWASLLAAWVLATYLLHRLPYFPLLLLQGPPERGKSRLAKALTWLSFRGIVNVSTSPAMLVRDRAWHRVTLTLDVEDLPKTIARGDYLGDLLLASYESGGQVRRCVRPDADPPDQADSLPAYGSTIVITNRPIRDDSPLASRCISVSMPEAGEQLLPDALSPTEALPLRARCVAWAAQLASDGAELPEVETVFRGRLRDLALPLLRVLALVASSEMESVAALLADVDASRRAEAGRSWEARVAVALWQARDRVVSGRLYMRDITDEVNQGLELDDPERLTAQQVGTARRGLGIHGGRGGSRGLHYAVWPGDEQAQALHDRYGPATRTPSKVVSLVSLVSNPHEPTTLSTDDPLTTHQEVVSPETLGRACITDDPDDPDDHTPPHLGNTPTSPSKSDLWTNEDEDDEDDGSPFERTKWRGPDEPDDDSDHDGRRGGRRRPPPIRDGGAVGADPRAGVDL